MSERGLLVNHIQNLWLIQQAVFDPAVHRAAAYASAPGGFGAIAASLFE